MKKHDTPEKNYDLERLIFFSDGVFAIAITLLAIELHPPEHWDGRFDTLFAAVAAKLIFYFISFVAIGLYWMAHRFVFRHVQTFNELAAFLNLLFLCLICLTPFANALIVESGLRGAVLPVYAGLMGALSVTLGILWSYVSLMGGMTDPRMTTRYKLVSLVRVCLSPLLIGGASLAVGVHFGIWASIAAVIIGGVISSRIDLKPFRESGPETT